jgi:hypothetical protein
MHRHSNFVLRIAGDVRLALNSGKGCGLEKLQPVIEQLNGCRP